jgi:mono/diheme cytochrome c family protein
MFRAPWLVLVPLFIAPVASSLAAPGPHSPALIARGHAIAKKNCARCHAIGASDQSGDPKSPPFRELARKYPISGLEESLAEGILVGHQGLEMPHFQLTPAQIEALLAYMDSVQVK